MRGIRGRDTVRPTGSIGSRLIRALVRAVRALRPRRGRRLPDWSRVGEVLEPLSDGRGPVLIRRSRPVPDPSALPAGEQRALLALHVEDYIESLQKFTTTNHRIPELVQTTSAAGIEEYLACHRLIAEVALPTFWRYYEDRVRQQVGLPPAPRSGPLVRMPEFGVE